MGKFLFLFVCLVVFVAGYSNQIQKTASILAAQSKILPDRGAYQQIIDGQQVDLYVLKNKNKMQVAITNLGARVVSLIVPDKDKNPTDVVLGFDSVKSYMKKGNQYFGATVGRYGNRIAKGKFMLDGKDYQLDLNNRQNSLHGGKEGFFSKVWDATMIGEQKILLTYLSRDGEGGYPGNVFVKVTYTLTNDNSLQIDYIASTDKNTVLNLTNHSFFNLEGEGSASINDHILTIFASRFTPIDSTSIPTGSIQKVAGTPFDFEQPTQIGSRLNANDDQLKMVGGYDHNYVLNETKGLHLAASVYAPGTSIVMKVLTTEPGIQFYSGNNLKGIEQDGKGKKIYGPRSGFCLETQHFPNSPNQPNFPSTVVKKGQQYTTSTIYKFEIARL